MKKPWRSVRAWLATLAVTALVGCAGPAPHYAPSIDNVETLRRAGIEPARTGTVSVAPDLKTGQSLSIRANTMVSGVGNHYGDYLTAALRQELELAKLYDTQSATVVSGTLLRNDISAGGMSINHGEISARFVVERGGQVRYDKVRQVRHEWEGAFAGAVAIPRAASNYPVMVQKLIGSLLADGEFLAALRK